MTHEISNKREFTRVLVTAHTVIKAGGITLSGAPTHSLSMKGMSIQTSERLPVGTECEITIVLVEGEVEIQVLGTVVVHLDDGIAFQFTKILGLESFEHLRNLVFYNAKDVEQVETEFTSHTGIKKRD
ncbi:MAG: PilZ domain-containing protein [Holophaga sp.]|nr:PilZ domain-containing protein [Holophaga sp.]